MIRSKEYKDNRLSIKKLNVQSVNVLSLSLLLLCVNNISEYQSLKCPL